MPSVYLETTIPSYLAAHPSRDLVMAAHQQITQDWLRGAQQPVLQLNEDVRRLVREYDRRLGLVGRARADLPHFAFAVAYQMDYLVTWNCRHIANGEVIRRLLDANAELHLPTPLLVTPEEIMSNPDEDES